MRRRPSARLLILDPAGRVLLFRFEFKQGALAGEDYWSTPGGGLEEGENFAQAAVRELEEETGIRRPSVGEPVAFREFVLRLMNGEEVIADEQYFLIDVGEETLTREGWTVHETEIMTEHKWWSLSELSQTKQTVWPANIVEMIRTAQSSRKL
jgi:8-oxo-dGTP diphosphatase